MSEPGQAVSVDNVNLPVPDLLQTVKKFVSAEKHAALDSIPQHWHATSAQGHLERPPMTQAMRSGFEGSQASAAGADLSARTAGWFPILT